MSSLVGDLSRMADVMRLARALEANHATLDLLLLNANSITQTHSLTEDGFEANLAVGCFGRALLALSLRPQLARTPGDEDRVWALAERLLVAWRDTRGGQR